MTKSALCSMLCVEKTAQLLSREILLIGVCCRMHDGQAGKLFNFNCEEAAKFISTAGSLRVLLVLLVLGRACATT